MFELERLTILLITSNDNSFLWVVLFSKKIPKHEDDTQRKSRCVRHWRQRPSPVISRNDHRRNTSKRFHLFLPIYRIGRFWSSIRRLAYPQCRHQVSRLITSLLSTALSNLAQWHSAGELIESRPDWRVPRHICPRLTNSVLSRRLSFSPFDRTHLPSSLDHELSVNKTIKIRSRSMSERSIFTQEKNRRVRYRLPRTRALTRARERERGSSSLMSFHLPKLDKRFVSQTDRRTLIQGQVLMEDHLWLLTLSEDSWSTS